MSTVTVKVNRVHVHGGVEYGPGHANGDTFECSEGIGKWIESTKKGYIQHTKANADTSHRSRRSRRSEAESKEGNKASDDIPGLGDIPVNDVE